MRFNKIEWTRRETINGVEHTITDCDYLDNTFKYEDEDEAICCYIDMLADRSSPIEGYIDDWDTKDGFTTYYEGEPVYKLYNFKCIPVEEE